MYLIPDDVFKHHIMRYLSIHEVVSFDSACINHEYRKVFLDKLKDIILIGDMNIVLRLNIIRWLHKKGIYLKCINLMRNYGNKNTMNFNELKMICNMLKYCDTIRIRDKCMLHAIAEKLAMSQRCQSQLLSLTIGYEIKDADLISISRLCTGLNTLILTKNDKITDASIISISTHCTGLHSLDVSGCNNLTDASIISISTHCTGLKSLDVSGCDNLTDASIISISTHCSRLQSLNVAECYELTDASIISISTHCTGLQSLDASHLSLIHI